MRTRHESSGTVYERAGTVALSILLLITLIPAFDSFAAQAQLDDTSPAKLIRQADKMLRQAKYAEAEKTLRDALAADPDNTAAKLKLAHVQIKRRNIVDGYLTSVAVLEEQPENAYAMAVAGSALLASGNFKDAQTLFYNAIQIDKREALAWAGAGMIDYYENRIDEALLNLKEAVFHDPDHADHIFSLAQVSSRAERYREAADAYERFLNVSREQDDDRRARIKGLINFLRFLGGKVALYSVGGQDATTVPFELIGNRPVIKVKVNGRSEPLRFILDTGSGITVLSDETAKRLNIKPVTRGGFAKGLGGDGKFEIVYGFLRQFEVGSVKVRNVPVYIRTFHSQNYRVDGYIGLALISKFLTTVDYGELTFKLDRKGDIADLGDQKIESLPLRLTSSGFLSGVVQLEGLKSNVNFIVDTGASVSVISNELAAEPPISVTETDGRVRVVGAAGVTEDVRSFSLPKLTFGANSRSKITAVALDLNLINEASGFEQGGILGGNFLKAYRLTFDFQNARVLFIPIEERASEVVTPLD